jgi:hypothetical protein
MEDIKMKIKIKKNQQRISKDTTSRLSITRQRYNEAVDRLHSLLDTLSGKILDTGTVRKLICNTTVKYGYAYALQVLGICRAHNGGPPEMYVAILHEDGQIGLEISYKNDTILS